MAKTTITAEEHLQIVGLLTLAKGYTQQLYDICDALQNIVQEETSDHTSGHIGDTVWSHIVDNTPVKAAQILEDRLKLQILHVDK